MIIPVYNELSTIGEVIRQVSAVAISKEIIVVDDGSTDGSTQVIRETARDCEKENNILKIHATRVNFGKGAAIRTGLSYVNGDVVIIQDADLELDPAEYHELIAPIVAGRAQVVYGSRFLRPVPHLRVSSRLANILLAWTASVLYRCRITDEATAYKVFEATLIKSIPLRCIGFEFCPEVTAKIRKRGIHIHEIPISYRPRTPEEGKKVTWRDGVRAMYALIRYRIMD